MDSRQSAQARIQELKGLLEAQPDGGEHRALIEECEALERAIGAFHMEGIRFRMFNVDRLIARAGTRLPETARAMLEDARRQLEDAGFHTRSHQAPT